MVIEPPTIQDAEGRVGDCPHAEEYGRAVHPPELFVVRCGRCGKPLESLASYQSRRSDESAV